MPKTLPVLKTKTAFRSWYTVLAPIIALVFFYGSTRLSIAQPQAATAANEAPPLQESQPHVIDLSSAARLMLVNDHTYRAAISEQAATQTERDKGRAGLLPSVQMGYSYSRVSGSRWQPDFRGQRTESDLRYNSSNGYVQLRQPLLDYGRYAGYQRGHALADQGLAVFSRKHQEAGLRVAGAYFNVVLAKSQLSLQEALVSSLTDMVTAFQARYRQSESTRTELQETEARLSLAQADAIQAQDQLTVASRELQSLIGVYPHPIAGLVARFPQHPLTPERLDDWLARARTNSPEVRAAQEAVTVANTDVEQAGSRYLPTLNLVATYGRSQSDSLSSLDQRTNTFTIGLQLDIPIFTGGYTTANVARARADRARLQHELTAALERTEAQTTRFYTDVLSGAERIKALQAAVESGTLSLASARKGFVAGTLSNIDVLNTQDKLFQARFELVRAQLDYLQARLALVAATGDLQNSTFDEINDTYLTAASTFR